MVTRPAGRPDWFPSLTHCITDSGPNFVKAFDEFGSIIHEEISICSSDDGVATQSNEVEAINAVSIFDFMRCEQDKKEFDLPAHVKCAAHKLNLVATKDSFSALSMTSAKKYIADNGKTECYIE